MSEHLIQSRWQLIRSYEQIQQLEEENIQLHKRINELNSQLVEKTQLYDKEKENSHKYKAMNGVIEKLYKQIVQMKQYFMDMKANYQTELTTYSHTNKQLNGHIDKLVLSYKKENIEMISSIDKYKKELEYMTSNLYQSNESVNSTINQLKQQIDKQTNQLTTLTNENTDLTNTITNYKQEIDRYIDSNATNENKISALFNEIKRLKSLNKQLDIKNEELVDEMKNNEINMKQFYEQLLLQAESEKLQLQQTIDELKDQLNKILNDFMGNKNHFARFVELKSENLNLQNKVNILTKRVTKLNYQSTNDNTDNNTIDSKQTYKSNQVTESMKSKSRHPSRKFVETSIEDNTIDSKVDSKKDNKADNKITSDITIGVPLLNKQTRDTLKSRISV